MHWKNLLSFAPLAAVLVLTLAFLPGCDSGEPAAESTEPPAPAVDARYASADAIIDHFNSLTTVEPVNVAAVYDLYYAENDFQRQLLKVGRWSIPIYDLESAMRERFNASIDPSTNDAYLARANQPATIKTRDGDRATAEYVEWNGKRETLQLVKWNNRWWLSGYSQENHPDMQKLPREHFPMLEMGLRAMGGVAPAMAARIRAGEFTTAQGVRDAIQAAVTQYVAQNAAMFKEYESYVRDNASLFTNGFNPLAGASRPR